jgi:hypothetical protein
MDIGTLKLSLADLLGLPSDSIIEFENKKILLSFLAHKELGHIVSLPDGFEMTHNIRVPEKGEYFLDLSSLVSDDRVIIYLATGSVHSANLILSKSQRGFYMKKKPFDFLMCLLAGGRALYKGSAAQILVPMVDTDNNVVIVDSRGKFITVDLKDLQNITYQLPDSNPFKDKHSGRFDLEFDDEGYDPGLN